MKKSAKVPLILGVIAAIAAVVCFSIGKEHPNFLWVGAAAAALTLFFLLMTLTRFLRNRSITSGLFISTTAITMLYFVGSRFINSAVPIVFASASVAAAADSNNPTQFNFATPVFFAQIGLFALWFLLILFIIYVYVRPIKKIDLLLSQIIEAKEIKKLRLGKSAQYQKIAAKLQVLADEKRQLELKKQQRLAKSRARAKVRQELVAQLLKEQEKIPAPKTSA